MTTSYGTQSFHGVSSEDFTAAAHIVKWCRNMEPFSKSAGRGCLRSGLEARCVHTKDLPVDQAWQAEGFG